MSPIFILVILLVIVAWFVFKPGFVPAPPKYQVPEKFAIQADNLKEKTGGWFKKVRPFWQKKYSLGQQLKAWSLNEDLLNSSGFTQAEADLLVEFQEWFRSLSDSEAELMAKELSAFCSKQGVNLKWLLQDKGEGKSEMQSSLSALVLFYSMAVRERYNSRPSAALRVWEDAPLSRSNRKFGNALYVKLVDAGLITIPANLLLASTKQRRAHQVSAIQELIKKDRSALLPYAAQVLDLGGAAKATASAPAPAAAPEQPASPVAEPQAAA